MSGILSLLLDKVIQLAPGMLVRLLFRPKSVAAQVYLRLREERPIMLALDAEVPHLDLYLETTNHSPFPLILERLLVEMWFGQPTFEGAYLERVAVPARRTSESVMHRQFLTSSQVHQVQGFLEAQGGRGRLMIHLTAYFNSKIGEIRVKRDIDRGGL